MGALGVEIAKNVVLSGVKRCTLNDTALVTAKDLAGQFFVSETDIGSNRALACCEKVQQLNYYVRVDVWQGDLEALSSEEQFRTVTAGYDVLILAKRFPAEVLIRIGTWCRAGNVKLIASSVDGVFARLINDWGPEFTVVDKNGEQG
jgi:molybdopterin/thiamine biosynthesis adenylyltransferase